MRDEAWESATTILDQVRTCQAWPHRVLYPSGSFCPPTFCCTCTDVLRVRESWALSKQWRAACSPWSPAQRFSAGFLAQGPGVGKRFSSILIAGLFLSHHVGFFTANRLKSTDASPGVWGERVHLGQKRINVPLGLDFTYLPSNDQLRLAPSTSADVSWGHFRNCKKRCIRWTWQLWNQKCWNGTDWCSNRTVLAFSCWVTETLLGND